MKFITRSHKHQLTLIGRSALSFVLALILGGLAGVRAVLMVLRDLFSGMVRGFRAGMRQPK